MFCNGTRTNGMATTNVSAEKTTTAMASCQAAGLAVREEGGVPLVRLVERVRDPHSWGSRGISDRRHSDPPGKIVLQGPGVAGGGVGGAVVPAGRRICGIDSRRNFVESRCRLRGLMKRSCEVR